MKRVLLKLSGEALAGDKKTGFDEATCIGVAKQVKELVDDGIQVAIVTGGGNLIVENTKIYAYNNFIITLRNDYGAFWNGTITLRDCHVINALKDDGSYRTQISMIIEADTVNHDFGYHTYFPNLIIDNLKIDKTKKNVQVTFSNRALTDPSISTLGMKDLSGVPNKYAYYPPDFVKVYNNTDKGYKILLPTNNGFFDNTEAVGVVRDRSYGT